MKRRLLILAAGLLVLLAAGFFFRPVTIDNDGQVTRLRGPFVRVGQALSAAGTTVYEGDLTEPGLNGWIPLNGKILLHRAVTVSIWEKGQVRQITSTARTPELLLAEAGIRLGPQDRIWQNGQILNLSTLLPVDRPVVLQIERACAVLINDNGTDREVLGHAKTPERALWDAGIRPAPADLIATAPGSLIECSQTVAYLPARPVTIQSTGTRVTLRTAVKTVGEALSAAGTAPNGLDYTQPAEDQPLPSDGIIRIVRVREDIQITEVLTPYESTYAPDPDLELDTLQLMHAGQYGVHVTRERVRFEDGLEINRAVDSDWNASEATPETMGYGTKIVIKSADVSGSSIEYWRKVRVYATSYSPCRLGTGDGRCSYITASGARLTKGIVAVPRAWFWQMNGQRVFVPGYGFGTIADTGGMRGMHIDLGFDEENFEQGAIVGWVDLYFLTPVPANIPWTLP